MPAPQMLRTAGSLLALLLTLLLTAGCGTAAEPPALTRYYDVDELFAAVAAQQRTDSTARFSLLGELVGAGDARTRFTGAGVLRMTETDLEIQFTQVVSQPDREPQETGFVVLSDAVYLRMPTPAGEEQPDRPWVRVDPNDAAPESQQLMALAASITQRADPTGTLARYADATLVADAADDLVDGAPAVRYTLVTDLARAAEMTPDPAVRAQLEQQVRDGLTRVTSTLWVDSTHRLLRSAASQELPGIGTLDVTGFYRDWGQPVQIEPPADDLVE